MKTTFKAIVLIVVVIIFNACDSNKNENKSENIINENDDYSVNELDEKTIPKVVGLWKLFKIETMDGDSRIRESNDYLNIKIDKTYESNYFKGKWVLTYGNSDGKLKTFIVFEPQSGRFTDIMEVSITNENNTTYLKLINLARKQTEIYVHQN